MTLNSLRLKQQKVKVALKENETSSIELARRKVLLGQARKLLLDEYYSLEREIALLDGRLTIVAPEKLEVPKYQIPKIRSVVRARKLFKRVTAKMSPDEARAFIQTLAKGEEI